MTFKRWYENLKMSEDVNDRLPTGMPTVVLM
jgi:hypothetical protein